jgi:hypothetical protein
MSAEAREPTMGRKEEKMERRKKNLGIVWVLGLFLLGAFVVGVYPACVLITSLNCQDFEVII